MTQDPDASHLRGSSADAKAERERREYLRERRDARRRTPPDEMFYRYPVDVPTSVERLLPSDDRMRSSVLSSHVPPGDDDQRLRLIPDAMTYHQLRIDGDVHAGVEMRISKYYDGRIGKVIGRVEVLSYTDPGDPGRWKVFDFAREFLEIPNG